ncbi:DUF3997 domain-containing protein [Pseudoalteromonas arabiensis]|uniref:DUF3997 domain-containing protein n=1 Tax=Pseudoalteromonas arabiensis TaxID=874454 RepID=UPI0014289F33|nr:DUF3997 domain-containing protein [Pseudoalteromonas arabiensis]
MPRTRGALFSGSGGWVIVFNRYLMKFITKVEVHFPNLLGAEGKNMKIKLTLLLTFMVGFLTACGQDRANSNIKFVDADKDHQYFVNKIKNTVIIPDQVVDVVEEKGFLLVLRMVAESIDCYNKSGIPTIITHYSESKEYWIINLNSDQVDGPFDEDAFKHQLEKASLLDINLKVPQNYRANTEYFNKEKSACYRVE